MEVDKRVELQEEFVTVGKPINYFRVVLNLAVSEEDNKNVTHVEADIPERQPKIQEKDLGPIS